MVALVSASPCMVVVIRGVSVVVVVEVVAILATPIEVAMSNLFDGFSVVTRATPLMVSVAGLAFNKRR